jgi:DNA-binding CsgD family transcriptional regulator
VSDSNRAGLLDRRDECLVLDGLVADVRGGRSGVLVLRGEAGIGKSELLEYLQRCATGCRVLTAAGVQSEMELSYAGLHQLCAPLLDGLGDLPEPQRSALATAFGMESGGVPDRFLVSLATLSLLANAGGDRSLVCVIDDAQWLDQASALTLGFVARRLLAESVLLVFAVREPVGQDLLAGLPTLNVGALPEDAARALLDTVLRGVVEGRVRDRLLAEAQGNPLALLELPRALQTPAAFGTPLDPTDRPPIAAQLEREFLARVSSLPADAQTVLLVAAADPISDALALRRAAATLGVDADEALSHADATKLLRLDSHARFRHPLVRSAAYWSASTSGRQAAHQALAGAIDAELEPDRHSWHRGQSTEAPDETIAGELVASAGRAQARGGVAAAGAFMERATTLTADPSLRAARALDAAQAKLLAGAFDAALELLEIAASGPPDTMRDARLDLIRAQIAFVQARGNEAPSLLLAAAQRLEQLDVYLSRDTYLDAMGAALYAGRLHRGVGQFEVAAAARRAPAVPTPRLADRLLDALALRLDDGYAASAPLMDAALEELCQEETAVGEALRWMIFGSVLAAEVWDHDRWRHVTTRHVEMVRAAGALGELPSTLDAALTVHLFAGELPAAEALIEEARTVCEAIGSPQARSGPMGLAVFSGDEGEARALIEATLAEAVPRGQGAAVTVAHWYHAVLCNSLGQYDEAVQAAELAAINPHEFAAPQWAFLELIEAAVKIGDPERAADAFARLSATTSVCGTAWARGVEARSRALLSEGGEAERAYLEAIDGLGRTQVRTDLARAHLLYGEWLRRENRRADARDRLGTALEMLTALGLEGFAERARRELKALGTTVIRPTQRSAPALTPQEERIARLAQEGFTNPEIGAQLFLSPHTVEWHLRKVYAKLGIGSRREIGAALETRPTSA